MEHKYYEYLLNYHCGYLNRIHISKLKEIMAHDQDVWNILRNISVEQGFIKLLGLTKNEIFICSTEDELQFSNWIIDKKYELTVDQVDIIYWKQALFHLFQDAQ